MERVGIIGGAGKMGSWFSKFLTAREFKVSIYDVDFERAEKLASKIGAKHSNSIEELVKSSNVIVVATPPHTVSESIKSVSRVLERRPLKRKVLLFDISTFKRGVLEAYESVPRQCKVASIHPLFGPEARNPKKHTVVLVPIPGREEDCLEVRRFFERLEFNVETVDLEVHEYYSSLTIGLSYALGLSLAYYTSKVGHETVSRLMGTTFKHLSIHFKSILLEDLEFIKYILSKREVKEHIRGYLKVLREILENFEEYLEGLGEIREAMGGLNVLSDSYKRLYDCVEL